MGKSWDEISHWDGYDFVLVNDDLDRTEDQLKTIITAARLRRAGVRVGDVQVRFMDRALLCSVFAALRRIVADGRESGEFERKTPLDEVTIAIRKTAAVYGHPVLLELNDPDELKRNLAAVTGLILRSLAP